MPIQTHTTQSRVHTQAQHAEACRTQNAETRQTHTTKCESAGSRFSNYLPGISVKTALCGATVAGVGLVLGAPVVVSIGAVGIGVGLLGFGGRYAYKLIRAMLQEEFSKVKHMVQQDLETAKAQVKDYYSDMSATERCMHYGALTGLALGGITLGAAGLFAGASFGAVVGAVAGLGVGAADWCRRQWAAWEGRDPDTVTPLFSEWTFAENVAAFSLLVATSAIVAKVTLRQGKSAS